jgi:penicillin amidase
MMARLETDVTRRRVPLLVRVAAGMVISLLIVAVVGVVGSAAWLKDAMREQLPVLDGTLPLAGLSAPVLVRRDALGVPHIQAATMDDLLEAQGYVVAQDRLWQMDMGRRFAAGELAELLGSSVIEHDRVQRILQIRPTAEHLTANMPQDQRRLFEDFARGVNAYIASHQDNLPAEFRLLGYKPRPWQPVDSWLVTMNMLSRLDTLYPWKLEREKVQARLGPTLAADVYPTSTWRDHPPTSRRRSKISPKFPWTSRKPAWKTFCACAEFSSWGKTGATVAGPGRMNGR